LKIALVTGASRGIASPLRTLWSKGLHVVRLARSLANGSARTHRHACTLRIADVERAVTRVEKELGVRTCCQQRRIFFIKPLAETTHAISRRR